MNKAYNRVCREVLWTDNYEYGVKGKLLKAVVGTYAAARETTKIGSTVSDTYKLPNGLRQGSVLSPILYILYTAKLIMMIEATNTGITTTSGTKIPCIMFVDDLATLAHTVASILKQYGAIQTYALTHTGVINLQISTVATSRSTETLKQRIFDTGIGLSVNETYVHLGARYKLSHTRSHLHLSPDARHRLSIARGMLAEMQARGLGQHELSSNSTLPIISKRVMTTATYSLSGTDMTATDRNALDNLLADATRLSLQWEDKGLEKPNWVILESDIVPPSETVSMNEVAAWVRATKKKVNPMIAELLTTDPKLITHLHKKCAEWGIKPSDLLAAKNKSLFATMRSAYHQSTRMKEETDELSRPCSKKDLGMHLVGTAVNRTQVATRWAGTLMRVRSILRHAHPVEAHKCPYCKKRERHSLAHVISRCSFPITLETRTNMWKRLTPTVRTLLKTINHSQLAGIMGGQTPKPLSGDERRLACEASLAVFLTSPLYTPPPLE
jgi:hypothetical protein